jgi:hypothetical protein
MREHERREYNAHVDATLAALAEKVKWQDEFIKMLLVESEEGAATREWYIRQNERLGWEIEDLKRVIDCEREGS